MTDTTEVTPETWECTCAWDDNIWMHHVECDLWSNPDFYEGTMCWDPEESVLVEAGVDNIAPWLSGSKWAEAEWDRFIEFCHEQDEDDEQEEADALANLDELVDNWIKQKSPATAAPNGCECDEPAIGFCAECMVIKIDGAWFVYDGEDDEMITDEEWNEAMETTTGGALALAAAEAKADAYDGDWSEEDIAWAAAWGVSVELLAAKPATATDDKDKPTVWVQKNCKHRLDELALPDGTVVYASGLWNAARIGAEAADFGVYAFHGWDPDWLCFHISWRDHGLPHVKDSDVIWALETAMDMAKRGDVVEFGCMGGHGRTGTMLAMMVLMADAEAGGEMTPAEAIDYIHENYCPHAIEGKEQEWYVAWYHAQLHDIEAPPKPVIPKTTYVSSGTRPAAPQDDGTELFERCGEFVWANSDYAVAAWEWRPLPKRFMPTEVGIKKGEVINGWEWTKTDGWLPCMGGGPNCDRYYPQPKPDDAGQTMGPAKEYVTHHGGVKPPDNKPFLAGDNHVIRKGEWVWCRAHRSESVHSQPWEWEWRPVPTKPMPTDEKAISGTTRDGWTMTLRDGWLPVTGYWTTSCERNDHQPAAYMLAPLGPAAEFLATGDATIIAMPAATPAPPKGGTAKAAVLASTKSKED